MNAHRSMGTPEADPRMGLSSGHVRGEGYLSTSNGGRRSIGLIFTIVIHVVLIGALIFQVSFRYNKKVSPTLTVFDVAPTAAPPEPETPVEPEKVEKPPEPKPPVIVPEIRLPSLNPMTIVTPEPSPPVPKVTAPEPRPPAPKASDAKPTWQGQVLAALNKVKRYPRGASARREQGMPWIRFTMNRQGRILSVTLERSSGFSALDDEAVSLPRRAQPIPKPPEEVEGDTIELVVPVEFFMR